eukprot:2707706-Rhodomonas_salina.3
MAVQREEELSEEIAALKEAVSLVVFGRRVAGIRVGNRCVRAEEDGRAEGVRRRRVEMMTRRRRNARRRRKR